jgi:hypothetical protein
VLNYRLIRDHLLLAQLEIRVEVVKAII